MHYTYGLVFLSLWSALVSALPTFVSNSSPTSVEQITPPTSVEQITPPTSAEKTTPPTSAEKTTPPTSAEKTTPPTSAEKTTPLTSAKQTTPLTSAVKTTPRTSAEQTTPPPPQTPLDPPPAKPETKPPPAFSPAELEKAKSLKEIAIDKSIYSWIEGSTAAHIQWLKEKLVQAALVTFVGIRANMEGEFGSIALYRGYRVGYQSHKNELSPENPGSWIIPTSQFPDAPGSPRWPPEMLKGILLNAHSMYITSFHWPGAEIWLYAKHAGEFDTYVQRPAKTGLLRFKKASAKRSRLIAKFTLRTTMLEKYQVLEGTAHKVHLGQPGLEDAWYTWKEDGKTCTLEYKAPDPIPGST